MTDLADILDAGARDRLDEYLDAIEQALADAGVPRSERRTVCDEVEAQACEMARGRMPGTVTADLMAEVIRELDPPDAYAAEGAAAPRDVREPAADQPRMHPFALVSILLPVVFVLLMLTPFGPRGEVDGLLFLGVVAVAAGGFAAAAVREIRRQPARFHGLALAVAGLLALPALTLGTIAFLIGEQLDPFGVVRAMQKEQKIQMEQVAAEYARAQGAPAPTGDESPLRLTESEQTLLRNKSLLLTIPPILTMLAAIVAVVLGYRSVYRWCRNGTPSPG